MYSDIYPTAVSDDLLSSATEQTVALLSGSTGLDVAAAASRAVRSLFCPCVCTGIGCGCAEPAGFGDAVVREVVARVRAGERCH